MTHAPYDPTAELGGGLRALEASAGTGKTHAITSTVLRLVVEHNLEMDQLLLVTFTRAATAELEQRVRDRLVEGADALARATRESAWRPDDDIVLAHVVQQAHDLGLDTARRRVEEALRTVDEATITTIHGFCHQVLQQAAVATDSDPAVAIDTDDDRLVTAVVDDWMIRFVHEHTPDGDPRAGEELVALLGSMSLGRDGLLQLARTVAAEPDPVLVPDLPDDPPDIEAVLAAQRDVEAALADAQLTIDAAQRCMDDGEINGNDRYAPQRANRLPGRIATVREAYDEGVPGDEELGKLDPAGDEGDGSKPMPDRIATTPLPQAVGHLRELRVEVEAWVRRRLADDVRAELRRRRGEAGTASFADLLRQLAVALAGPAGDEVIAEIGAQFRAVLVDEFQDTDPVQWAILHTLFGDVEVLAGAEPHEVGRFDVVGDPKQAIYGWRGADLETYKRALTTADDTRTFARNYRSDAAYVAACNQLLDTDGSLGGRGVEYVAVDTPDRDEPRLVDPDGTDQAGLQLVHLAGIGGGKAPDLRDAVAADVAEDIVRTLRAGLQLPHEEHADDGPLTRRPLRARDCAVLVRRHAEAAAVADQLRLRGLAVVIGGGTDVLLSDEAQSMGDLLRVLTAPGDERALRRLLVGPFVGLDAQEVTGLTDEQWQAHYLRARTWATTWADDGIAAAVQRTIREGEAEQRLARLRDGERTMTNLRHLTELLHLAEQSEALGTHALAAWFDARRAEAQEEDTPPERELRLERDDAAVKVMTVHAAKGLEFPLVWVPYLWVKEGRNDGSAPFVVNDPANDHRRTVSLHPASSKALRNVPERARLREVYDREQWESGMRLAYVALTRAMHRCTVHTVAHSWGSSVVKSSAWQLLWRELGSGAPDSGDQPKVDEDVMLDLFRRHGEHEHIDLRVVPEEAQGTRTRIDDGPAEDRPDLKALHYDRDEPLDTRWGRASFTGLLRHRAAPAAAEADADDEVDRDQAADRHAHGLEELPREVCEAEPDVPLAPLPRGAAWGTFLHDVLEHADFDASRDELGEVVRTRARWASARPTDEDLTVATGGLHAALQTPLGPALGDLRLRELDRTDRLDELDFTLTLGQGGDGSFDVASIANVFEQHAAASDAPLAAAAEHLRRGGTGRPVHGLLIGSIDLALRHDGRFWIADYKSNGLGQWLPPAGEDGDGRWAETQAHTTPDRVMVAMLKGDYLLQAHLYVVALHRYLWARLGDTYDYESHVGGWAYLFLRGMTGDDVRHTRGRPHGIATGRPTRELIEDLDQLLRGA